ncbi:MAG: DUF2917 domain-containing protein [Rubrivivax sp.]
MSTAAMTSSHQSAPWEWTLEAQAATRLPALPQLRWLHVTAGRVWLTRTGAGLEGGDVWLDAGERHALPAGSEWVVECWPEAKLSLLEAAPQPTAQHKLSAPVWGRAFVPVLRAA